MEGFMKDAVETVSGTVMCIPSFMKIGSGIQHLMGRGNTDMQTKWGYHKSTFIFST
jgi:hypothetical protein